MKDIEILFEEPGIGEYISVGDQLTCHYKIVLPDQTLVRDSRDMEEPFVFVLGEKRAIEGFERAVIGMQKGGLRKVKIPAPLAYGSETVPGIPANSDLILEIQIIDVRQK